jgi:PAS domain S-box-containing protein
LKRKGKELTERRKNCEMKKSVIVKLVEESEEKYGALVQNSPDIIGIIQDGALKYINKTGVERLGWSYEELTSPSFDPVENVIAERYRGLIRENVAKRLRGENPPAYEVSLLTRGGSEIPVIARGARIIYEGKPADEFVWTDITERRLVEEAQRRQSDLLLGVFNSAKGAIFILDAQNPPCIIDCNQAASEIFGYERSELLGRTTAFLHVSDESLKQFQSLLYPAAEEGRQFNLREFKMRRKDGSVFPSEHSVSQLLNDKGERVGWVSVVRDITEQVKYEAKLRSLHQHALQLSSSKNLDDVVRYTLDAIQFTMGLDCAYVLLVEGGLLRVRGVRGRGLPFSSMPLDGRGLTVKAAKTKSTIRVSDTMKERDYADPKGYDWPVAHTVRSQLIVPILIDGETAAVIALDNDRLDAFTHEDQQLLETLSFHVASALKRLREEEELKNYSEHLEELVEERTGRLAESEARYRRLFESSPISLWEEDFSEVKKHFDDLRSKGIENLREYLIGHPDDLEQCASRVKILNVNESTLKLFGVKSAEELKGELRKVLTDNFEKQFREELVALGEGKTRFESEFDNQTLTGDIKHVSVILSVIPGYEDTLAKVLVSIIDLTERKEMEQRLQQAERLAAVGETAAMVAHDLRNPLQGITTAIHLLKQESLTVKERDEMLQLIQRSVDYSESIVRDLSAYSGEIHLKPVEATPRSIVTEALSGVRVPREVAVNDFSAEYPALTVDLERMRRVFINLIENAIDAMPQGGTLTINSKQSNGDVEIAFSDTGSGMSGVVMQNLWKPLQTTKAKGMGLGLAICKRILDAHGGNISVKGKGGEGTTVTVRLPIKLDAEVRQE